MLSREDCRQIQGLLCRTRSDLSSPWSSNREILLKLQGQGLKGADVNSGKDIVTQILERNRKNTEDAPTLAPALGTNEQETSIPVETPSEENAVSQDAPVMEPDVNPEQPANEPDAQETNSDTQDEHESTPVTVSVQADASKDAPTLKDARILEPPKGLNDEKKALAYIADKNESVKSMSEKLKLAGINTKLEFLELKSSYHSNFKKRTIKNGFYRVVTTDTRFAKEGERAYTLPFLWALRDISIWGLSQLKHYGEDIEIIDMSNEKVVDFLALLLTSQPRFKNTYKEMCRQYRRKLYQYGSGWEYTLERMVKGGNDSCKGHFIRDVMDCWMQKFANPQVRAMLIELNGKPGEEEKGNEINRLLRYSRSEADDAPTLIQYSRLVEDLAPNLTRYSQVETIDPPRLRYSRDFGDSKWVGDIVYFYNPDFEDYGVWRTNRHTGRRFFFRLNNKVGGGSGEVDSKKKEVENLASI